MDQVAELGVRSLILSSSFCFLFFSSSPITASIAWVGMDGFALCSDLFFLRSFFDIVVRQPRGSRTRLCLINKYKYYLFSLKN